MIKISKSRTGVHYLTYEQPNNFSIKISLTSDELQELHCIINELSEKEDW